MAEGPTLRGSSRPPQFGVRLPYPDIYAFRGTPDGAYPSSAVTFDAAGAIYGVTSGGGYESQYSGTVYKLTSAGANKYTESVLYAFKGGLNGFSPIGDLVVDGHGVVFGTAQYWTSGAVWECGLVFKLEPHGTSYTESLVYRFSGGGPSGKTDGCGPQGGLRSDSNGNLYGTTVSGGDGNGCGTVFELTPRGQGYSERVLYSFQCGNDGWYPAANVIEDGQGALYGTTEYGGGSGCQHMGCGIVFKLTPAGSAYRERVLHRFDENHADGTLPSGRLLLDTRGRLLGTTQAGGNSPNCTTSQSYGCGAVFRLTPSGSSYVERVVHSFGGYPDGSHPFAGLTFGPGGKLFGTTFFDGTYGSGAVFYLAPARIGFTEGLSYAFSGPGSEGAFPASDLTLQQGYLYGTATWGGPNNHGVVFRLPVTSAH